MTDILIGDFLVVLYIFLRIVALFFTAPILGDNSIPAMTRIMLSFVLAYIVFLTIDKNQIVLDVNLISIFVNGLKEILTGMVLGFSLNIIFYGISYAGHLIGYDMGLMFSEVLNPMQEINNNIIGEMIYYAGVMLFILINGHHHLISAVVSSFKIVPLTKYTISKPLVDFMVVYSVSVFTIALKIAAPIMVSFFLIHIAEGIIARVIPQIQIFYISQPLKIGLGLIFLTALVPLYIYTIKILLNNYETQLSEIIKAMSV